MGFEIFTPKKIQEVGNLFEILKSFEVLDLETLIELTEWEITRGQVDTYDAYAALIAYNPDWADIPAVAASLTAPAWTPPPDFLGYLANPDDDDSAAITAFNALTSSVTQVDVQDSDLQDSSQSYIGEFADDEAATASVTTAASYDSREVQTSDFVTSDTYIGDYDNDADAEATLTTPASFTSREMETSDLATSGDVYIGEHDTDADAEDSTSDTVYAILYSAIVGNYRWTFSPGTTRFVIANPPADVLAFINGLSAGNTISITDDAGNTHTHTFTELTTLLDWFGDDFYYLNLSESITMSSVNLTNGTNYDFTFTQSVTTPSSIAPGDTASDDYATGYNYVGLYSASNLPATSAVGDFFYDVDNSKFWRRVSGSWQAQDGSNPFVAGILFNGNWLSQTSESAVKTHLDSNYSSSVAAYFYYDTTAGNIQKANYTPKSAPATGTVYWDADDGSFRRYDGSAWADASESTLFGTSLIDLLDSEESQLLTFFANFGFLSTSKYLWIADFGGGEPYIITSYTAATTTLAVGNVYYNTTNSELKLYTATGWSAGGFVDVVNGDWNFDHDATIDGAASGEMTRLNSWLGNKWGYNIWRVSQTLGDGAAFSGGIAVGDTVRIYKDADNYVQGSIATADPISVFDWTEIGTYEYKGFGNTESGKISWNDSDYRFEFPENIESFGTEGSEVRLYIDDTEEYTFIASTWGGTGDTAIAPTGGSGSNPLSSSHVGTNITVSSREQYANYLYEFYGTGLSLVGSFSDGDTLRVSKQATVNFSTVFGATFLSAQTEAAILTHFQTNTYDNTTTYIYYDSGLGELRKITAVTQTLQAAYYDTTNDVFRKTTDNGATWESAAITDALVTGNANGSFLAQQTATAARDHLDSDATGFNDVVNGSWLFENTSGEFAEAGEIVRLGSINFFFVNKVTNSDSTLDTSGIGNLVAGDVVRIYKDADNYYQAVLDNDPISVDAETEWTEVGTWNYIDTEGNADNAGEMQWNGCNGEYSLNLVDANGVDRSSILENLNSLTGSLIGCEIRLYVSATEEYTGENELGAITDSVDIGDTNVLAGKADNTQVTIYYRQSVSRYILDFVSGLHLTGSLGSTGDTLRISKQASGSNYDATKTYFFYNGTEIREVTVFTATVEADITLTDYALHESAPSEMSFTNGSITADLPQSARYPSVRFTVNVNNAKKKCYTPITYTPITLFSTWTFQAGKPATYTITDALWTSVGGNATNIQLSSPPAGFSIDGSVITADTPANYYDNPDASIDVTGDVLGESITIRLSLTVTQQPTLTAPTVSLASGLNLLVVSLSDVPNATSYTIQYRESGATDWLTSDSTTITGLTNGTDYEVQAIAHADYYYDSPAGTATGAPKAPPDYKTWMLYPEASLDTGVGGITKQDFVAADFQYGGAFSSAIYSGPFPTLGDLFPAVSSPNFRGYYADSLLGSEHNPQWGDIHWDQAVGGFRCATVQTGGKPSDYEYTTDDVEWGTDILVASSMFTSYGSGSAVWMGSYTETQAVEYFDTNTYDSNNTYYYYDSEANRLQQILTYIATNSWQFGHDNTVGNPAAGTIFLKDFSGDFWVTYIAKNSVNVDLAILLNAPVGSLVRVVSSGNPAVFAEGVITGSLTHTDGFNSDYIKVPVTYTDSGNLTGSNNDVINDAYLEVYYPDFLTWSVDGKPWVIEDPPDKVLIVNDKVLIVNDKVIILEK